MITRREFGKMTLAGLALPRLVSAFERWGFTWGGRWLVPDGMHFEIIRHVTAG